MGKPAVRCSDKVASLLEVLVKLLVVGVGLVARAGSVNVRRVLRLHLSTAIAYI